MEFPDMPGSYSSKIEILIVLLSTILLAIGASARIDKKAVMGCWLFDEGKGDAVKDYSGNNYWGKLSRFAKRYSTFEIASLRSQ